MSTKLRSKPRVRSPRGHAPLDADALYLLGEGTLLQVHDHLGAHRVVVDGVAGTQFAVWAPNAAAVSVVGDFNGWDGARAPLSRVDGGVWAGFLAGVGQGAVYKYRITRRAELGGGFVDKLDPVGLLHETPPQTGSIVWDLDYAWGDAAWIERRAAAQAMTAPISVYEVHPGSWMRVPEDMHRSLGYRELAHALVEHVGRLGFTHVELMPIAEHPFYGSWGYQTTGYFAPTHRHGKPQDLMYLVDLLHQAGIGVLLDITPAHFPADDFALARYDGTCLYEHEDPRRGRHPDWDTLIFNYGRREVVSFLQSAAMLWLERYHFDGLRVDAVASMLYLDYSRKDGEWLPNERGGRENLEAVAFLQALNQAVHARVPGAITIAEESTAWPGVTAPVEAGGLGFDMKWDMGWMHDTLRYLGRDPLFRSHHHDELTFRQLYAQDERFMLPLSHDEVVHGKRSLLGKMHGDAEGDPWRALAHLRLLLAYQFTMPGKKLLFMGSELASPREWDHDRSLDWHLGDEPGRAGVTRALERLADLYRGWPALHEGDFDPEGFSWVVVDDRERSVYAYLRRPQRAGAVALVILNFTPVPRPGYSLPAPGPGPWRVILNTDAAEFGGSGGAVRAELDPADGEPALVVDLPPLAALILRGDEARA